MIQRFVYMKLPFSYDCS